MPNTPGKRLNRKHYRLLPIEYILPENTPPELLARTPRRMGWYLCRCDCGTLKYIQSSCMSGTKSCGCLNREQAAKNGKSCGPKIKDRHLALSRRVANGYRSNARTRGISWDITVEQVSDIVQQPCFYCGASNSNIMTMARMGHEEVLSYNGIDRIDPAKGYTINNIVPCCGSCNTAKLAMSYDTFIKWVDRIYHHLSKKGIL